MTDGVLTKAVVTWEEVACMVLSFFIVVPANRGPSDPFEFFPTISI